MTDDRTLPPAFDVDPNDQVRGYRNDVDPILSFWVCADPLGAEFIEHWLNIETCTVWRAARDRDWIEIIPRGEVPVPYPAQSREIVLRQRWGEFSVEPWLQLGGDPS